MSRKDKSENHRDWKTSWGQPGVFKGAWVGDNPTYARRRAYTLAFFEWHIPPTEEDLRKMEYEAKWEAVKELHRLGMTKVGLHRFSWEVDKNLWSTFCEYCAMYYEQL
jgi:hypothetical protein